MRSLDKQGVRKLIKLNKSYALTLPINDIRKLGWREKQKVTVQRKGNTLVITDWEES